MGYISASRMATCDFANRAILKFPPPKRYICRQSALADPHSTFKNLMRRCALGIEGLPEHNSSNSNSPPQESECRVMTSENDNTKSESPDTTTDEDWKDQVKAEDAVMEEKIAAEKSEASASTSEADPDSTDDDSQPLPPADFTILISMFSTQVMLALGMIPGPDGQTVQKDLRAAKHFIDFLSVLEEKTKGNLTAEEQEMLTNTTHYLRMAFVEQSNSNAS